MKLFTAWCIQASHEGSKSYSRRKDSKVEEYADVLLVERERSQFGDGLDGSEGLIDGYGLVTRTAGQLLLDVMSLSVP